MHILFLTPNFPPEGNAPASRTYEHAKEWVKSGHKVTIITGAPNFPDGKVFSGYKNVWYGNETVDSISVIRVKTYITANDGLLMRILSFLSFMVTSFIAGLFVKKPDVVVGTSPQFFTVVSAWALAAVRFKPFVFELRDIWPASIAAVGAMKASFLLNMLEKLELFLYSRADSIVVVTNAFKDDLISRGVSAGKIDVILNGVDLSKYTPASKDPGLVKTYGFEGKFVAGYVGTHGVSHALETIVDAAEQLKDQVDIAFLFAGGGAEAAKVAEMVLERKLGNVTVLGRQEKSLMPRILALCDVSLVHLKDIPLFEGVIPSKIFESMGMGLPIIIGVPEGEATKIVSDANAGLVIKPESSSEMATAISFLLTDTRSREEYALNSLQAAKSYNRETQARSMLDVLVKIAK